MTLKTLAVIRYTAKKSVARFLFSYVTPRVPDPQERTSDYNLSGFYYSPDAISVALPALSSN